MFSWDDFGTENMFYYNYHSIFSKETISPDKYFLIGFPFL